MLSKMHAHWEEIHALILQLDFDLFAISAVFSFMKYGQI